MVDEASTWASIENDSVAFAMPSTPSSIEKEAEVEKPVEMVFS